MRRRHRFLIISVLIRLYAMHSGNDSEYRYQNEYVGRIDCLPLESSFLILHFSPLASQEHELVKYLGYLFYLFQK